MKHISLAPDLIGQIVLKDELLSQSASDIRKNLQNMAFALDSPLDTLVRNDSSVFYNQDQEEGKGGKQRPRENTCCCRLRRNKP